MRASETEQARAEAMARLFAPAEVKRERLAALRARAATSDKHEALAKLLKGER